MKNQKMKASIVSLSKAYELTFQIATKLKAANFKPDLIIAIARGGYPPARFLADFLEVKQLTSLQLQHYAEGAEKSAQVKVLNELNIDLSGKKVLIADDVNDTGDTLVKALDYIRDLKPAAIKTAVLHEKQNTKLNADIVGDYLQEWQWLIYQWAAVEDVHEFIQKADENFSSRQEAEAYLQKVHKLSLPDNVMTKVWEQYLTTGPKMGKSIFGSN